MKQYHQLLRDIQLYGTNKPAAREGMPGSTSLFGYQFRHSFSDGFPLITTKKMYWKGVVVELLWFLRGDTNIKYLVDNGVNIWNEDAYQYYKKRSEQFAHNSSCKVYDSSIDANRIYSFDEFISEIKSGAMYSDNNYTLGDCGYQYGKVWRKWEKITGATHVGNDECENPVYALNIEYIDQISNVINSLRNTPESRRHIITAIDPAHDQDLALYWCHCLMQFNCRPITDKERIDKYLKDNFYGQTKEMVPKYYLDCQLYQRSADVLLGVPFNIASYALLTHIFAKMCNMIPGEFVHTFGDVHIYENHMDAVNEQLSRDIKPLPKLVFNWDQEELPGLIKLECIQSWYPEMFKLEGYNPHPKLKSEAKLSTGLK